MPNFFHVLFLLSDLLILHIQEKLRVAFRFHSAPAFRIFGPAAPYAEGSKRKCPTTPKGLSENGIDREIKVKGLLSLFLYRYAISLIY